MTRELTAATAGQRFSGREWTALAVLFALGAWLRVRWVADAFLFGDEIHSLRLIDLSYRDAIVSAFRPETVGMALPVVQKLAVSTLGSSLVAIRLPALVPALATLCLLPWIGRRLVSRGAGLLATALFAASTFAVFYARFARGYSLLMLIALLFVAACTRIAGERSPRAWHYAGVVLAGAVLPCVHLATAPFAAAVGGATIAACAASRRRSERALPLALALVAAAGVAWILHYPAWHEVVKLVEERRAAEYPGPFGPLSVATVLAGSRTVGAVLLVAVPLAAVVSLRRHGIAHVPLAVAALAPLPLVFATQPFGDAYAYARYASATLPAVALLVGELLAELLRAIGKVGARAIPVAAVILGVVLIMVGLLRGTDDGPYANTYLSLVALPAFDVPYPEMPDFYRSLPPGASIIESPALLDRSRQLYRNYYLQHRHPTVLGFLPQEGSRFPGPHVDIAPPWSLETRADFLVLHRDAATEVASYWRFVYHDALQRTPSEPALMDRQSRYAGSFARPSQALIDMLTTRYGAPEYEDARIIAFRLRPRDGQASRRGPTSQPN